MSRFGKRFGSSVAIVTSATLITILASCTSGDTVAAPAGGSNGTTATASDAPASTESPGPTEPFPRDSFSDPTTVDNPYLSLQPGAYWEWDGVTVEDGEETSHQIITMITDMTKEIDGVTTVVGYDEDWAGGQLVEAEIFFAAQDDDGTVWRLGEYPEEYEDGEIIANPGWIAGAREALPGISMPAEPKRGGNSYSQGWGPAVDWADRGWVIIDGRSECVPTGCYDEVIVVEEWDVAEPLVRQLKFHAPGVGVIKVDWSGSADDELETLELIEFRQLGEDELADLRTKALELEDRAYDTLPEDYGGTEPMQRRS